MIKVYSANFSILFLVFSLSLCLLVSLSLSLSLSWQSKLTKPVQNIAFLINYEQSKSWPHLQNLIKTHIQQVRGMKWFVSYFYWILPTFGNIVNLEQRPTLKCFDTSRCSILYDFNILQLSGVWKHIALRMLPSSTTILYLLVYYWTSSYWLGTGN